MRKFHFLTVLITLLFVTTMSTASDEKGVRWDQSVDENFESKGCVSLPAIPGIAQQCSPSITQRYPCGFNSNLSVKICEHRFAGVCTPAIPSIKASEVCGGNSIGKLKVSVVGGVSPEWQELGLLMVVDNEVTVEGFGQEVSIPMSCSVPVGVVNAPICLDLVTGEISSKADLKVKCKVGVKTGGILFKGVAAKACFDHNFTTITDGNKTGASGSVTLNVDAQVALGSVNVSGHTIRLATKVWKPTLGTFNFVVPPIINPVALALAEQRKAERLANAKAQKLQQDAIEAMQEETQAEIKKSQPYSGSGLLNPKDNPGVQKAKRKYEQQKN